LLLVHGTVVAVALLLPVSCMLRAALIGAALVGLAHGLGAHVLRTLPWSVVEATWQQDGDWVLTLASGREVPARLLPSSYVSPALVVLNLRVDWWLVRSLVLPRDALDADLHRRLRARLRLAGHIAPSAPDRAA
jgi:toxin CptA